MIAPEEFYGEGIGPENCDVCGRALPEHHGRGTKRRRHIGQCDRAGRLRQKAAALARQAEQAVIAARDSKQAEHNEVSARRGA